MTNGHDSSTRRRTTIGLFVATATMLALTNVTVAQITIDDFNAVLTTDSSQPSGSVSAAMGIIGDWRDGNLLPSTGGSSGAGGAGKFTFKRPALDNSVVTLDWDGLTAPPILNETGLAGEDLTATGVQKSFQFDITRLVGAFTAEIQVYTDATNASTIDWIGSLGTNTVPYGCFTQLGGTTGPADFANVGAIVILFGTGPASAQDWDIGAITTTTNEPACPPLPVEMSSFDATVRGGTVSLAWTTASETNTIGFAVEHRALTATASEWTEVGFVDATGNSSQTRNYAFGVDALNAGLHAFRLRVVDVDGRVDYSETIEVSVEAPGSFVLGAAYPNPFNPSTSFTLALDRSQMVEISVFDLLGRRVKELHRGTLEGGQTHVFRLDATDFETGLYVIRAIGESGQATSSVTLVK